MGETTTVTGVSGSTVSVTAAQTSGLPANIASMVKAYLANSTSVAVVTQTGGTAVISPTVQAIFITDPGPETIYGSAPFAFLAAGSHVTYIDTAGGSATVISADPADVLFQGNDQSILFETNGDDTVTFNGTDGTESVVGLANDPSTVYVGGSDDAVVTATGSAAMSVVFLQNAGGDLNFINNSTSAQTVFSGNYTLPGGGVVYANNAVTAFGGAGGGFYVGGHGGSNSLVGGTGIVTLQGGGPSDFLKANGFTSVAGTANVLFAAGGGAETLLASSTTGNNIFQLGLQVVGSGTPTPSADIVSTSGSLLQQFIIGNDVGSTLTGSSVASATNQFAFIGDSTIGGGSITIADFNSVNSSVFFENSSFVVGGTGAASIAAVGNDVFGNAEVGLSDGTIITFKGLSASQVEAMGATIGSSFIG